MPSDNYRPGYLTAKAAVPALIAGAIGGGIIEGADLEGHAYLAATFATIGIGGMGSWRNAYSPGSELAQSLTPNERFSIRMRTMVGGGAGVVTGLIGGQAAVRGELSDYLQPLQQLFNF